MQAAVSTPEVPRPCACTTVRKASRTLARAYDEALHGCPLNVTQLALLRAIERRPGEPLNRVAEELSMDRSSVYRAIGTMARQGWVQGVEGKDARSRSAQITADGQGVLRDAAPLWEGVQRAVVERFGRDRWGALVSELQELQRTVQSLGDEGRGLRKERS